MTKRGLEKGYFQDKANGSDTLARTQVYLSKTKLRAYKKVSSCLYTKSTSGVMMS